MKQRNIRMIETNGIRLKVVVEGSGPLLLLLHGFPQSGYLWRNQIDDLVAAGYQVAPDSVTSSAPRARREHPELLPAVSLTHREQEVAVLLVDGLTNGQVAERLYISPKTAAVHVSNILAKLGLSSRAEIAAWTVRNSLDASGAPKSA